MRGLNAVEKPEVPYGGLKAVEKPEVEDLYVERRVYVAPLNIASFPSSNKRMQFQEWPKPTYKFVTSKVSQQSQLFRMDLYVEHTNS
jgi:hypothetical protein